MFQIPHVATILGYSSSVSAPCRDEDRCWPGTSEWRRLRRKVNRLLNLTIGSEKRGSFEHLKPMKNRKRTMLLPDGAKCYPKMAWETSVLHEWVAHKRGEFEKTVYRGMEKISCHTDTGDAAWSAVKNFIPNSLCSQSKDLLLYVKCRQWRYVNLHTHLHRRTVSTLKSLLWREEEKGVNMFQWNHCETHTKHKFGNILAGEFCQLCL